MKHNILEKYDWHSKHLKSPVIGVDEVGRGCLAGPVYASAVIINPGFDVSKITDSKKLSESRRESLANEILLNHKVGIGVATVKEIEELNILQASLLAMKRAVDKLNLKLGTILVDGRDRIPNLNNFDQIPLIQGDLRAVPIGAASIVAKVARDKLMNEMHFKYPEYRFDKHKGYGTKLHKEAIKFNGPTTLHRSTFAGVREYIRNMQV